MQLLAITDPHFDWLLGEADAPPGAPGLPEGGFAEHEIIVLMRSHAAALGGEAVWLMVASGEVIGMISIKARDQRGRWDIGYWVAPSRERRGHATAAVAALMHLARDTGASGLTAETLPDSGASPRVLERNGFACIGQFDHPEDGIVDQWVVEWAT